MIKFIDLFAGLGGTRIGFELACLERGLDSECVFSSEIKPYAIKAYKEAFKDKHEISGDITKIQPSDIPDFDVLLAGFPCQPFSSAGNRQGFLDERGNLFFNVLAILKEKRPGGFLLENVEGLVNHDDGKTLKIMLNELAEAGYKVTWKTLDSSKYGVPQKRIRVYIGGSLYQYPNFENLPEHTAKTGDIIDTETPFEQCTFSKLLTKNYTMKELYGKSIKDKRGGKDNIHSWDIGLKGLVNKRQSDLLTDILKKRRYKKWSVAKGIEWMDGMPLTLEEIRTFQDYTELEFDLEELTKMGYLKFEHPKKKVVINGRSTRVYQTDAPQGYNIIVGSLSFKFARILHPDKTTPTLVATEAGRIAVSTKYGVRPISVAEGLAFSGFPSSYDLKFLEYKEAFDLIGNTVMPPVIKLVSLRLLDTCLKYSKIRNISNNRICDNGGAGA